MASNIPDLQFETYDEFRKFERAIETLGNIVDMLRENKNNLALCEELFSILHNAIDLDIKWVKAHIGNQIKGWSSHAIAEILAYQHQSADIIIESLTMADQIAQAERRDKRADS